MLAALFGWLPWLAVLAWTGFGGPLSPPGPDQLTLILTVPAALGLSFVFLCLRLLPWSAGLRDPGLWMPQAVCGILLMLGILSLLPGESRLPVLLCVLPWLGFHGARLGASRVVLLLCLVAAVVLAMPLFELDWMPAQSFEQGVNQALGLLLAGMGLVIPLMALERMSEVAGTTPDEAAGSRSHMLGREELLASLKREMARRMRRDVPFSVCVLAVDDLSRIHLEHGESISKRLKQVFGKTILSRARQLDEIGRRRPSDEPIGEFTSLDYVAVLPETSLTGAVTFANRIRHAVEQLPIRLDGKSMRCTASVGVAEYRKDESPGSLLLRAQLALERAQRLGSNRVERETSGG